MNELLILIAFLVAVTNSLALFGVSFTLYRVSRELRKRVRRRRPLRVRLTVEGTDNKS